MCGPTANHLAQHASEVSRATRDWTSPSTGMFSSRLSLPSLTMTTFSLALPTRTRRRRVPHELLGRGSALDVGPCSVWSGTDSFGAIDGLHAHKSVYRYLQASVASFSVLIVCTWHK